MTASILGLLLAITAITAGRVIGYFSPSIIFLSMQYIMAVGTIPLLDPRRPADQHHLQMIISTFVLFALITLILSLALKHSYATSNSPSNASNYISAVRPNKTVIILIIVSVIICILYYRAIGYNFLWESLTGQFGNADDIAALRLEAYAGSSYYFPGYVNQFKNSLLPSLATLVVIWLYNKRKTGRHLITIVIVLTCLLFIMGSGQRGALVTFFIVLLVLSSQFGKRALNRTVRILLIVGIPLFLLGSLVLGRSNDSLSNSSGSGERLSVLFQELVSRILDSNQLASVAAFRYVETIPSAAGAEWFQSLIGLLPGVSGSTLGNEIFAQLYGSDRGTAPPSIWTSIYYNFGDIGFSVSTLLLAVIYFSVSRRIALKPASNTLEAVGMAGVVTIMGTWVAGGPEFLLNSGLGVYVILWLWGTRIKASTESTRITPSV